MTTHVPHARALLAAALLCAVAGTAVAQDAIQAVRVTDAGPLLDPDAPFWSTAPATSVAMLPQMVTTPSDPAPAIKGLTVKAAHNGQWLAIRIEWPDPTKSDRIVVDQFGDQVAIEFPVEFNKDALPSPMMGNPGGRVKIWQWRAAFQEDLARGRPETTHDLYPNALIDIYPDQVLRATDARPYMGAVGMNNPITQADRSPVLEQIAEGWGSLTVQKDDQQADGRGVWKDGAWRVVITHPLAATSTDVRFAPGGESVAAFAVWDGGSKEVGPRKGWASWTPFKLAP